PPLGEYAPPTGKKRYFKNFPSLPVFPRQSISWPRTTFRRYGMDARSSPGVTMLEGGAAMKITAIEITRHRLPLDPPFRPSWDFRPREKFDITIVRVKTDEGLEGVGSGATMTGF